jgi:CcmD family protein
MGPWGYVILAYGIVWATIVLYLVFLKYRLRKAEAQTQLRTGAGYSDHNEK